MLTGVGVAALFTWLALRPQPGNDSRLVEREFLALGTLVSVSVYRDTDQTPQDVAAAIERLQQDFIAFNTHWSAWGSGELGQINQALAAGKRAQIPADMRSLFDRAARYTRLGGGGFDVRVGNMVRLWGFDDESHYRSTPPENARAMQLVQALAQAPPLVEPVTGYGPAPSIQFDFGAIAKGEAIDRGIALLRMAGLPNAIVNAGGNLRTSGRRGGRPWRIGIRHPRPTEGHYVMGRLDVADGEAVVTSGDYERYFEYQGRRFHHLLDPRRGEPAQGLQAVTVVAPSGAQADGATAALFVAGPDGWPEVARALGLDQVLVVEADGRVRMTAALAARIELATDIRAETLP